MTQQAQTFIRARASLAPNGCWEWLLKRDKWGYGTVSRGVLGERFAHRAAYVAFVGPIEPGKLVLHRCDNPACVNPDHLYIGTAADNARDRVERGRHRSPRGELHPLAKLNTEAAAQIRKRRAEGETVSSISRTYQVDRRAIRMVLQGKTWR